MTSVIFKSKFWIIFIVSAVILNSRVCSQYKILARVDSKIKPGETIAGFTIRGIQLPPLIDNSGNVLFTVTTDNGDVSFINNRPIAYKGMVISGDTLKRYGTPAFSNNGSYAFYGDFTQNILHPRGALVVNGSIELRDDRENNNGLKMAYSVFYAASSGKSEVSDIIFDASDRYQIRVPLETNNGRYKEMKYLWVSEGIPIEKPTRVPEYINPSSSSTCQVNNQNQAICYSLGPYLKDKDGKFFPIPSNRRCTLNDNGKIFTDAFQIFDYSESVATIDATAEKDAIKHVIDIPFDKLLGLQPVPSTSMYSDGGLVKYPVQVHQSSSYPAFNNKNQFAVLISYSSYIFTEGLATPAVAFYGNAILTGKAEENKISSECPSDDNPQVGDVVIYWGPDGGLRHSGYVTQVNNCKVTGINCWLQRVKMENGKVVLEGGHPIPDDTLLTNIDPDDSVLTHRFGSWTVYHTKRPYQRKIKTTFVKSTEQPNPSPKPDRVTEGLTDQNRIIAYYHVYGPFTAGYDLAVDKHNCHGYTFDCINTDDFQSFWHPTDYDYKYYEIIGYAEKTFDKKIKWHVSQNNVDQATAVEYILRDNSYTQIHVEGSDGKEHFNPGYNVETFSLPK